MGAIVFLVILALAIVASVIAMCKMNTLKYIPAIAIGICSVLFLGTAWASCVVTVPTKEYGVVTKFGRPVGMLTNGIHLKSPLTKVTDIDASIQTDSFTGKRCIDVRISRQATACVNTSIRWRIKPAATDSLFQDYRNFEKIRDSLVTRDLGASLNEVFSTYDPLGINESGNSTSPSLPVLSTQAQKNLIAKVGSQIEILSVIIPVISFDANTQSKVNALLAQVAQTRIAGQSITTAQKQAQANKVLSTSVSKDPNVLVARCLDLIADGKAGNLPAGFSCWPGQGSAVVVPSAK